ncbi:LOW QUALITY PROTEIN: N-acylglucosamine 2-epimerase [Haliaeetus albicilla]|uniref:LOW QUALITY PROTEIN: N-acylglucosamine 2-epimerase n=1 Tax=Haliaeetus albicilla TaxID=8969 RepID=UPI0037E88539
MASLSEWRDRMAAELDAVVAFWERHSHDPQHGGFFSCLSRDGTVYDETKYVWMQGRQVWVYSRLYRTVPRFRRPELLEAARAGGEFLLRCARLSPESPRVAFALTRDGRPVWVQRTVFSEAFCAMGLDELGRAAEEPRYRAAAREWALAVGAWARGAPQELGRPRLSGTPPQQALAVPMLVLALAQQLLEGAGGDGDLEAMAEWGAQNILLHLQRGDSVVLENVSPEGQELPGSLGRLMNPGHAMEAGWLLLWFAGRRGDAGLGARAVAALVEGPLRWGWDPHHGGLFAFLDADGHCPTQLEWNMKLWWPQAEAMVALLAAYTHRPRPRLLRHFQRVAAYLFDKFRDPDHGEWFGYLSREGTVALTIKGGPFKGCFHAARSLLLCEEMLGELLQRGETPPDSPPSPQ